MIGLDTNVLLRLYLSDDPLQARQAKQLFDTFSEENPGYINVVTLSEFIWTLRHRFRVSRQQVGEIIDGLLESRDIMFEDEDLLEIAVDHMSASPGELPDILISLRNLRAGCSATKTFDRKAVSRIPGMELIS